MAQSGTVASGGSVDLVVASYETLRVYDAGGIARTNDGVHPNPSGVLNLVNAGIVRPDMFTLT